MDGRTDGFRPNILLILSSDIVMYCLISRASRTRAGEAESRGEGKGSSEGRSSAGSSQGLEHRLEFSMGDHVLPRDMTVYQVTVYEQVLFLLCL